MNSEQEVSAIRLAMRKEWLANGRGDKGTILEMLTTKDVSYLTHDTSMAEVLEDVLIFGTRPPRRLEWYERDYLMFLTRLVGRLHDEQQLQR